MHCDKTKKPQEKLEKGREEKDNEKKDIPCATVNMSSQVIGMCVCVFFLLKLVKNSKIYSMLDTCSQATFAKENLWNDLCVKGTKTLITVKTMTAEVKKSSQTLEDLELAQTSNEKAERY